MHSIRIIALCTILLAIEGYGAIAAYTCKDLLCLGDVYWAIWSLWIGFMLALLITSLDEGAKGFLEYVTRGYSISSVIVLYPCILTIIALLLNKLSLTILNISLILTSLVSLLESRIEAQVANIMLAGYTGIIAVLSRLTPSTILIPLTHVVGGYTILALIHHQYMLERVDKRASLMVVVIGLLLILVAGFYAVYTLQPYVIGLVHNVSSDCGVSSFCIVEKSTRIPLAAWGYASFYSIQMSLTGVLLTFSLRR